MAGTAPRADATTVKGPAPSKASGAANVPAATVNINPAEIIDQIWKDAGKKRVSINKELQKLQNLDKDVDGVMAGFEKIQELLARHIIMADIKAATEKKVEDVLWGTHAEVTKAYRSTIKSLSGSSNVVTKRKLERHYQTYLKISQQFYKAFLQRFCGSFKMKELTRVARVIKFEDEIEAVPAAEVDDAEAQGLANVSFHNTLIYLGDLSRYRTILQGKNRSFTSALTYYTLANELMPQSGFGYHQSGVIYGETGNHFECVYHMYRAMACDQPHPLARSNLEREFGRLRQSNAGSGAKGSVEAMASWFVKLHAFYYHGDDSTQNIQKELENEVTNRLAMTFKAKPDAEVDRILLKMVLINITAYTVGRDRIQVEWSDAKSRSCQLILQWNVRTIHTISKLLRDELAELVKQKPAQVPLTSGKSNGEGDAASKFTAAFHRTLPLFRVYMTWLCSYSSHLVEYREYLQPEFEKMCGTLAQTLTLVFKLLKVYGDPGSSPSWLFPEDEETIGMECLNGPELYTGCQLRCDALTNKPKPRADEVSNGDVSPDMADSIRSFDIVLCGLRLVEDSGFPVNFSAAEEKFSCVEGIKLTGLTTNAPIANPQPPVSANTATTTTTAVPSAHQPPAVAQQVVPVPVALEMDSEDFSDDQEFFPQAVTAAHGKANPGADRALNKPYTAPATEFPIEVQLNGLLNDYLLPPEPSVRKAASQQDDTSYSMGSATARDVFGGLNSGGPGSTSPTPNSATSKTFPSLPWEYFYPNTPTESAIRDPARIRSAGLDWDSRPGSSTSGLGVAGAAGNPGNPGNPGNLPASRPDVLGHANRSSGQPTTSAQGNISLDWAAQTLRARKAMEGQSLQAQKIRDVWGASGLSPSYTQLPPGLTIPPGFGPANGQHYTGGYQAVARPGDYGVVEPNNSERQALLDAFARDTTAKPTGNGVAVVSSGRSQTATHTAVSAPGKTGWNAKAKPK
ncbi:hypothetical protein OQA88_167 [Cercophora sp. LCS_1]